MFTDKLPNTRGLGRDQIIQDVNAGHAILKAQGKASAGGTVRRKGGVRRRGAYGGLAFAATACSRGFPRCGRRTLVSRC